MGSFSIYCAGCGSTFDRPDRGSKSRKALVRRRRRVKRIMETGTSDGEDEEESDEEGDEGKNDEEEEEEEEIDSDAEIDEVTSYDPEILSSDDLNWIENLVCVGFDEDVEVGWLSGLGYYVEQSNVRVKQGDDTNCPEGQNEFSAYLGDDVVYPFHLECFDILTRVLTGSQDVSELDKSLLYRTLAKIDGTIYLDLDYQPIAGVGQFWEPIPGYEFCVKDPDYDSQIKKFLQAELSSETFRITEPNPSIPQRAVKDPLGALPYDILHTICSHLPGDSVVQLSTASLAVFVATSDSNGFWKQLIRREMPWFWELLELIAENDYSDVDFKRLLLWLEKATTPRFGMDGIFLAVANRRRIWGVGEQIASQYFPLLDEKSRS